MGDQEAPPPTIRSIEFHLRCFFFFFCKQIDDGFRDREQIASTNRTSGCDSRHFRRRGLRCPLYRNGRENGRESSNATFSTVDFVSIDVFVMYCFPLYYKLKTALDFYNITRNIFFYYVNKHDRIFVFNFIEIVRYILNIIRI